MGSWADILSHDNDRPASNFSWSLYSLFIALKPMQVKVAIWTNTQKLPLISVEIDNFFVFNSLFFVRCSFLQSKDEHEYISKNTQTDWWVLRKQMQCIKTVSTGTFFFSVCSLSRRMFHSSKIRCYFSHTLEYQHPPSMRSILINNCVFCVVADMRFHNYQRTYKTLQFLFYSIIFFFFYWNASHVHSCEI